MLGPADTGRPPTVKVTPAGSEHGQDDSLPFAAEVGEAAAFSDGFAVGAIHESESSHSMSIVLLDRAGHGAKVIPLGTAHGDIEPPRVAARGPTLIAGALSPGMNGRSLRLAKIEAGELTWGATILQKSDESQAFDLGLGEKKGIAVWDEDGPSSGVIQASTFDVANASSASTPRTISPPGTDAESPVLAARPGGGYWLAYIARRAGTESPDAGYEAEPVGYRWIEVLPLDAQGSPTGVGPRGDAQRRPCDGVRHGVARRWQRARRLARQRYAARVGSRTRHAHGRARGRHRSAVSPRGERERRRRAQSLAGLGGGRPTPPTRRGSPRWDARASSPALLPPSPISARASPSRSGPKVCSWLGPPVAPSSSPSCAVRATAPGAKPNRPRRDTLTLADRGAGSAASRSQPRSERSARLGSLSALGARFELGELGADDRASWSCRKTTTGFGDKTHGPRNTDFSMPSSMNVLCTQPIPLCTFGEGRARMPAPGRGDRAEDRAPASGSRRRCRSAA